MLRIFLILSLAVSLAGVVFSFVLKDKVTALTTQRDNLIGERDKAVADAGQARDAEKKAKAAEKAAIEELDGTKQELASTASKLNETEGQLTKTASELQKTTSDRDIAQRELAAWKATGVKPEQIMALKTEGQRLLAERDAFAEEKKVMAREISRINGELDVYRGRVTEVLMPDIRARITQVDNNFQFVVIDKGTDDGLRQNAKMIVTRGNDLVAKVQLVRVDSRSAVANLLPEWKKGDVKAGDNAMTSYEALAK